MKNRIKYSGTRQPLCDLRRMQQARDELKHLDVLLNIFLDGWEGTPSDIEMLDELIARQKAAQKILDSIQCGGR